MPCTEHMVRVPHLFEVAILGYIVAVLCLLELLGHLLTRGRVPFNFRRVTVQMVFQFIILWFRVDVRLAVFAVLMVFWIFSDNFPWKKWRNKLSSKVSSLTEVARAAIQRQQDQAFG